MQWIDTHAHLYAGEFDADRQEMMSRAVHHQVGAMIVPNVDKESIEGMLQLERRYPGVVYPTMGLHPCYVKKDFQQELYIMEEWLSKRTFTAIGEIGTDLYWDKTTIEAQKEALKVQCDWALKYSLPVIIHCRESIDLTIDLLEPMSAAGLRGVFHCFTGSIDQARRITAMGFKLGIGGVSTFKKGGLDLVLPALSSRDIVLETDCPYLAPVPHRGKRNEPSYLTLVADRVSLLMGMSTSELASVTTGNARSLFKL
ncbi:MAG: TatD family hydrolase [Cyclobacteriaceae bacterium]